MRRIMLFFILLSFSLLSQSEYQEVYEKSFFRGKYLQKVPVLLRIYPVYREDQQFRVYFILEIKYSFLQFLLNNNAYTAEAEMEVVLKEKQSGKLESKLWYTQHTVETYELTKNKNKFHLTVDYVDLPPGEYNVFFKYHDLNGQQQLSYQRNFSLPEVERLYALRPLLCDPRIKIDTPFPSLQHRPSALAETWNFNRDLGIYLQAWREDSASPVSVSLELIEGTEGETLFALNTPLSGSRNRQAISVTVPAKSLYEGRHRLMVTYHMADDSTRYYMPIDIIWFDKPFSLRDYELSYRPLQYIVDEKTFRDLGSGDETERQRNLKSFWEERDPTPDTPFNELKNEFYTRVDSAIVKFSSGRKLGWQTDPGKIYIANGAPHKIDDHSLDPIPNPYMRWIYFQNGKQVVFTFRAIDGRKEYVLADAKESRL